MEWLAENLLAPLIVAVIAGSILAAFNWRRLRNWVRQRDLPPPEPSHFTMLVADLDGDTDGRQTGHVVRALEGQEGIRVLRDGRCLRIEEVGDRAANIAAAMERGRKWLAGKNADVLIWGEVTEANKVLHLRLLGAAGPGDATATGYALGETYDLPENFGHDFSDVLVAAALAAAEPATEQQGRYIADLLSAAIVKLERLNDSPPAGFTEKNIAAVRFAFATAALVLGEQSGQNEYLEKSVQAYRAVLTLHTRDQAPLDWAMTQNNLGNALQRLGGREEGTGRLGEAVAAYRAALEVHTSDQAPLDWAATQNNLGSALEILSKREEGTARLNDAVTAFHAALEVRTRDRVPLQWAMTQNNLGNALSSLGEREEGTARLEEAVAAFHAALEVYTRDHLPLDWAMTQNNLGSALVVLGEREEGTARLEEAVTACRAALEVRTRDRLPVQWATTQNNLGSALLRLGEREEETARLKEAITAYEGALDVFEAAEGADYYVSLTKKNLAQAQQILAGCKEN